VGEDGDGLWVSMIGVGVDWWMLDGCVGELGWVMGDEWDHFFLVKVPKAGLSNSSGRFFFPLAYQEKISGWPRAYGKKKVG